MENKKNKRKCPDCNIPLIKTEERQNGYLLQCSKCPYTVFIDTSKESKEKSKYNDTKITPKIPKEKEVEQYTKESKILKKGLDWANEFLKSMSKEDINKYLASECSYENLIKNITKESEYPKEELLKIAKISGYDTLDTLLSLRFFFHFAPEDLKEEMKNVPHLKDIVRYSGIVNDLMAGITKYKKRDLFTNEPIVLCDSELNKWDMRVIHATQWSLENPYHKDCGHILPPRKLTEQEQKDYDYFQNSILTLYFTSNEFYRLCGLQKRKSKKYSSFATYEMKQTQTSLKRVAQKRFLPYPIWITGVKGYGYPYVSYIEYMPTTSNQLSREEFKILQREGRIKKDKLLGFVIKPTPLLLKDLESYHIPKYQDHYQRIENAGEKRGYKRIPHWIYIFINYLYQQWYWIRRPNIPSDNPKKIGFWTLAEKLDIADRNKPKRVKKYLTMCFDIAEELKLIKLISKEIKPDNLIIFKIIKDGFPPIRFQPQIEYK